MSQCVKFDPVRLPRALQAMSGLIAVLAEACSGLRADTPRPADEVIAWRKLALDNGYAVMVLDSLSPRGFNTVCPPPCRSRYQPRRARRMPWMRWRIVSVPGVPS
jgi:hypothetical protein